MGLVEVVVDDRGGVGAEQIFEGWGWWVSAMMPPVAGLGVACGLADLLADGDFNVE